MNDIKRIFCLDIIRSIATILVVLQHVSCVNAFHYNDVSIEWWWVSNFYDSISRVCVPFFFLLTGALMLGINYNYDSLAKFLYKRLSKIGFPLIGWSFIYTIYFSYWTGSTINFYDFAKNLISGQIPYAYHFWFLYTIFGLYLLLPVLNVFICNASKSILNYFIICWFSFFSVFPLLELFDINLGVFMDVGSGYIGYLVLGYILRCKFVDIINSKKKIFFVLLIFVASFFFTMFSTYYLTITNNGILNEFFYRYLSINVVIMAVCAMILMLDLRFIKFFEKNNIRKVIVYFSSKLSFGVYLVHLLVLAILDSGIIGFRLNGYEINPLVFIPITTTAALIVSALIVAGIRRVPFLKNLVP